MPRRKQAERHPQSEAAAVVQIPALGSQRFQIRETNPFLIDVVKFHNSRVQIDEEHRDGTGAEVDHYIELVRKVGGPDDVTGAEAIAVVNKVGELMTELRDFFGDESGSPTPTATSESSTAPTGS